MCAPCVGDTTLAYVPIILLGVALVVLFIVFVRGGKSSVAIAGSLTTSVSKGNISGAVTGLVSQKSKAALNAKVANTHASAVDKASKRGGAKAKAIRLSATLLWLRGKLQVKIKILLSLLQVLSGMGFAFAIPYPPVYESTVGALGGLISIDLPTMMPLDCIFRSNYFGKLVLQTVTPLVVYAMLFGMARVFRKRGQAWQAGMLIDGIFFIMFLM